MLVPGDSPAFKSRLCSEPDGMSPGALSVGLDPREGASVWLMSFCLLCRQLVTAIFKVLSAPSVTPSLASATVSRAYMLGSVTDVSLGIGAFPAASPASVMVMLKTATQ